MTAVNVEVCSAPRHGFADSMSPRRGLDGRLATDRRVDTHPPPDTDGFAVWRLGIRAARGGGRGALRISDPVSAAQRLVGGASADEAVATRDQDVLGQDTPSFACGAGGSPPACPRRSPRLAARERARSRRRESRSGEVS
ncbi:Hypothetical protein A7982_01063 [Minicystis rosea]|nr:Hypothetical protein A7982_01063 [Minicystis rosea]